MIKFNNSNINDWNFDDSNIIKVYHNGAVCYYKITPGGTQVPCFAVVADISQYSDTEFEDVFNQADGKWYKLNNLNQYEEYGVYGSSTATTYYDGKLVIQDGYEYQYSGGSWVNVGEVSGSSRVPLGYSEVEYTESSGSQYIDTNAYLNTSNFEIGYTIVGSKQLFGYSHQGCGGCTWLGAEQSAIMFWGNNDNMANISSYLTSSGNTVTFSPTGATINDTTTISKTLSMGSDSIANIPLLIFARYNFYNNTIEFRGSDSYSKFSRFYLKNNGELVRDFVAAKRDNDNEYGLYDLVSNTFFTSPNGNSFTGGATTTGITVYPVYYDEKSDPPDNLSFSSMTEAESYECPWWGMSADIENVDYMFCEGNEWLTKYTYIEVSGDYLCDNGNKYKKMQEYDRIPDGTTTATTTYVKGDLIESASTDCSTDYSTQYLTLVAQTDNVSFKYDTATSSNKLQYSLDSGSTWNNLSNNQSTTSVNTGDKVLFKASGLTVNTERGVGRITPSASATVEGNIMSLEYGDNFIGQTVVQNNYQFRKLFSGVTTITSAENMVLPATTLKQQCYSQMFQGCTSLTATPITVGSSVMTWSGDYCMSNMFSNCTSLVHVSSTLLPALNLGTQCYWYMFENSTSLIESPLLLATTLGRQSYQGMFNGCSSLNTITCLATNQSNRTNYWTTGVAATGTFYKHQGASWASGVNGIPNGWTVVDYSG